MMNKSQPASILWLMAASSLVAYGLVDDSRPDLSMFKLRPVDTRQLARSRLGKPITDLATAAIHMHESLFVEANNVKCPAYAHLFKLVKRQQERKLDVVVDADDKNMIRLDLVASLAIVVTYDRILYHELFLRDLKQVSVQNFLEAIELLEGEFVEKFQTGSGGSSQKAATWFDLMQCLSSYMTKADANPEGAVSRFLADSARQSHYKALAKFLSIPIATDPTAIAGPTEGEGAPEALVRNLANRYEQGIHSRAMFGPLELRKSAEQIELLEDEPMLATRRQIKAEWAAHSEQAGGSGHGAMEAAAAANNGASRLEGGSAPVVDKKTEPEMDQGRASSSAAVAAASAAQVELVVPMDVAGKQVAGDDDNGRNGQLQQQRQPEVEKDKEADSATNGQTLVSGARFHEAQMAILKFIKMRLEQRPTERFERAPRLSMQLAFDFISHWNDLRALEGKNLQQLDGGGSSSFKRHALAFLRDPNNVRLARRVQSAIGVYVEMTKVLAGMKQQAGRNRYNSMDELRIPLERLTKLLNSMDGSFDVDDIRRLHSIWQAKYTEYSTMDRFINSVSW